MSSIDDKNMTVRPEEREARLEGPFETAATRPPQGEQHLSSPVPTTIILHKLSRTLELEFDTGERFLLPCAYLRAFSTSAEMRHGAPLTKAEMINKQVNILAIEPVGNYAIKPVFSDGHRTGIYSWHTLYELGKNLAKNWQEEEK